MSSSICMCVYVHVGELYAGGFVQLVVCMCNIVVSCGVSSSSCMCGSAWNYRGEQAGLGSPLKQWDDNMRH